MLSIIASVSEARLPSLNSVKRLLQDDALPSDDGRHSKVAPKRFATNAPSPKPNYKPTVKPSSSPTTKPISNPTWKPTRWPSSLATKGPTSSPSIKPSDRPFYMSTTKPISKPSARPSKKPTSKPTSSSTIINPSKPSSSPSSRPTVHPTSSYTSRPTGQSFTKPTNTPSIKQLSKPSRKPTAHPSFNQISSISIKPSSKPINMPSAKPTSPLNVSFVESFTFMMGFDLSSIKTSSLLAGSFNIFNDTSYAIKTVSLPMSYPMRRGLRVLVSYRNLNLLLESITFSKSYDRSCLPSFVVSKSCVVIVSVVTLSANVVNYDSNDFYERVESSMGTSRLFLKSMNNSRAIEVLYLGRGDINLPPESINPSQQSAVLIGSIVGSIVAGLAFISIILWIAYRRKKRRHSSKHSSDDPDDFELFEDPDTPLMDFSNTPERSEAKVIMLTSHGVSDEVPETIKKHHNVVNDQGANLSGELVTLLPYPHHVKDQGGNLSVAFEKHPNVVNGQGANLSDELVTLTHPHIVNDRGAKLSDELMTLPQPYVANDQDANLPDEIDALPTAESDLIVSRINTSPSNDELSFHESDASTIDDDMIQELENLIRVDDWEGINADAQDDLSFSYLNEMSDNDPGSNLSREEVQEILRASTNATN